MISDYRFVILHGTCGYPNENWFHWLGNELKNAGARNVLIPQFPTPEGQSLWAWSNVFRDSCVEVNEGLVLIGHSLGALFILRVLESYGRGIRACFLVSGLGAESLGIPRFDSVNASFTAEPLAWEKLRGLCSDYYVVHGDDDPYVPLRSAYRLGEGLHADVVVIKGGGHLNQAAGFVQFPRLMDLISQELR